MRVVVVVGVVMVVMVVVVMLVMVVVVMLVVGGGVMVVVGGSTHMLDLERHHVHTVDDRQAPVDCQHLRCVGPEHTQ